jgi:hypothetical protein
VDRKNLASALLLIGALRHYGWALVPAELAGVASKGLGAVAILSLLALLQPKGFAALVAAWIAFEELQVLICSAMWMRKPWHVEPGQAMCSAFVGFDIGSVSLVIVAALAVAVTYYSSKRSGEPENV